MDITNQLDAFMTEHFPYVTEHLDTNSVTHTGLNLNIANANLLAFCKCLTAASVNYRLVFGTLLGIYRDNSLIPHDTDIDIAIKHIDADALSACMPALIERGFTPIRYSSGTIMSLVRDGIYIDIYFFKQTDDVSVYRCSSYELADSDFTCDTTIEYLGYAFKTISDPIKLFLKYYGEDWLIPIVGIHANISNDSKKIRDVAYWHNYYSKQPELSFQPSDFAAFVRKYINAGDTIIDLGCGNGRDSVYFARAGVNTVGVDQCVDLITNLNIVNEYPNLRYVVGNLGGLKLDVKPTHCYSRFSLHSIDEWYEAKLLSWVVNNTSRYFFIETRSDEDILVGKSTDHYRRFINMNTLLSNLMFVGFDIKYAELSRGFSKYKEAYHADAAGNDPDPMLIRVVAQVRKS